jgi:hypothetical protein
LAAKEATKRKLEEAKEATKRKLEEAKTSRHRGVCRGKGKKNWKAEINFDGKSKSLGTFVDEDDAGRGYDAAIRKHFPDERPTGWTRFNFPSADCEEGSGDGGDRSVSSYGGTSRHRGVSLNKRRKKWEAMISVDSKRTSLGTFVDEDDAARAYDAYIRKHYPDERPRGWTRFNFPSAE